MANMGYCMFTNTLSDYEDCYHILTNNNIIDMSDEEINAAERLLQMSFNLLEELGFITPYGEFDYEECKIFFERLKDGCQ